MQVDHGASHSGRSFLKSVVPSVISLRPRGPVHGFTVGLELTGSVMLRRTYLGIVYFSETTT